MIIYNVTVNVEDETVAEWVAWMKGVHIPEMLKTGYFKDAKFLKLLTEVPDSTGETFAVQYFVKDEETLTEYINSSAPLMRKKHEQKFGGKVYAFRTVLEEL